MLVLSRNVGEVIRIGAEVEVKVWSVKGGSVRIGVDAPRETLICRAEKPRGTLLPCRRHGGTDWEQ